MSKSKKLGIIIPARYESSRLPGKPLIKICGITMIERTWMQCCKAIDKSNIYIATDNIEIAKHVESFGGNFVMTSKKCLTGTDRIAEANKKLNLDLIINVQGDEPMIDPNDIKAVIQKKEDNYNKVINCYCKLTSSDDPNDINLPKVTFNEKKELIYMSRLPIPGIKNSSLSRPIYYKQVCIYAFNREELEAFQSYTSKSEIECMEDIEILRFLEFDKKILMIKTNKSSLSVDIIEDIDKVEDMMRKQDRNVLK